MHWYSFILPLIAAVVTVSLVLFCPTLNTVELQPLTNKYHLTRRDSLIILIITAIYAVIAFTNLGNTTSPQSEFVFSEDKTTVEIQLNNPTMITRIEWFSGINTGTCAVEFSKDGSTYESVGKMDQIYSKILKWCDAELQDYDFSEISYIRLISNEQIHIYELALYDSNSDMISTNDFSYSNYASALFDEQELVEPELTFMNSSYFDEVYHPRTAIENLENIYPYEISHPPLGKLIIALGMKIFGVTPFGWRVMGTLFGVAMLPFMYILLSALFADTVISACGTAIFAYDFMHFVQTRIATIDSYAVFFIILMYIFMYLYISSDRLKYLGLSGLFFGIGIACKWTCFYAGAGLAVIWLAHWIGKKKEFRIGKFILNCLFCIVFFIIVPGIIYYVSYIPYGKAVGLSGIKMLFSHTYLDTFLDNQKFMLSYHSNVSSTHPYESRWYQWMLDIRPILYYLEYYDDSTKLGSFGAFVNPMLCWGGLIAMFAMIYLYFWRKDKRAGFILVGYLAQLIPWIVITRTTFEYHYFACTVFLVLSLCYILYLIKSTYVKWKYPVFFFTGFEVSLFALFYPVLTGITISRTFADTILKWLPTWPF